MKKVLITGANGLLGQHLVKFLLEKNYVVIATGKGEQRLDQNESSLFTYYDIDVIEGFSLHEVLKHEMPDVVVHAAAMTQIDDCELQPEQCERVNVQGTAQVLLDAEAFCKHFIYISTDFVFDGVKGNYNETDDCNPVSFYGFTKLQSESMVEMSEMPWTIVRTCLVYGNVIGGTRSNIVSWVKNSLTEGKKIKVVNDQVRTPTFVEDLVRGIELIIDKQAQGFYHIAGKDVLTPYEMAIATAEHFNLNKELIEKVDASVFTQPAKRPPKTGLDITKARKELGFEPVPFSEALKKLKIES